MQKQPTAPRRRWLARVVLYTPLAGLALLILIDPFSRQWLLGPTFEGVPLCYWQDVLRERADRDIYQSALRVRVAQLLGMSTRPSWGRQLPPATAIVPVALSRIDDPHPKVRASLGEFLRADTSPEAHAAIVRLLDDPEPGVRRATAAACAHHAAPPVGDAVRNRLVQMLDDPDGECRLAAALAVCRQTKGPSRDAKRVLCAALAESDFHVRMTAIWTLGHYGAEMPESLPVVRAQVLNDSHKYVRMSGSAELHRFGAAAIPVLVRLLDDPEPRVRVNACHGLGMLGAAAREAVPALRLRLSDSDGDTRLAAGEALRQIDAGPPPD
jgi:HEAT repeat protein